MVLPGRRRRAVMPQLHQERAQSSVFETRTDLTLCVSVLGWSKLVSVIIKLT